MELKIMEYNKVINGECLEEMKKLPDNCIDSIVTDPPYGINFMGKKWDYDVPSVDIWKECLRILKPGGHLLAFSGTRTYHRMTINIEDAGFEIRDMISWVYGSGFPKSLNIGKVVDKKLGNKRVVIGKLNASTSEVEVLTKGSSEYEGWGTALKPAMEPITVARKPLSEKTIAENVLQHGTGGINIDDCRIKTNDSLGGGMVSKGRPKCSEGWDRPWMHDDTITENKKEESKDKVKHAENLGRFPANLILSHHPECDVKCHPDCPISIMDKQSGVLKSGDILPHHITHESENKCMSGKNYERTGITKLGSTGGASRFFYCAKTSTSERGKNNKHPTVKPIKLMEYLVKLVTPKDGICLDPFSGSGSTLMACKKNGYKYFGIEREKEYCDISIERLKTIKVSKLKQFMKKRD